MKLHAEFKQKINNRYQLLKEISRQPNKKIFLVEDIQNNFKFYFLSGFLCESQKIGEETLNKFKPDLDKLQKINHPQVQGIKEYFYETPWLYLVFDYIEGESYEEIRQKQEPAIWTEYETVTWLNQLLPVLANLHSQNISHRNLSLKNIICAELNKTPVLINFGIEREIEKYIKGETPQSKPWHSAIRNREYQDLQDLAVTALTLLSGKNSEDLYNTQTKKWNWNEISLLSDRRQQVFRWILENQDSTSFSSDAILQSLNTERNSHNPLLIPPLILNLIYVITGAIGILLFSGAAIVLLKHKNPAQEATPPVKEEKDDREEIKCPTDSTSIAIFCDIQVSDIDSKNFDRGELTLKFTRNETATVDDRIEIYNLTPESEDDRNDGYAVTYKNNVIGTATGGIGTTPLKIVFNANANSEAIQGLIHKIVYRNASSQLKTGTRTIQLKLTDGDGGTSDAITRTIEIHQPNQQPSVKLPSQQTVEEDKKLTFSGITVSDLEADSSGITIQLKVSNGNLQVRDDIPNGLNSNEIQQQENDRVVLTGTFDRINATLSAKDAIIYQGKSNFNGTDTLTVTALDRGKSPTSNSSFIWPSGALEPKKTTKRLDIVVQPINDKPTLSSIISTEPEPPARLEKPDLEEYYSGIIPVGSYSFYESGLGKNVSYTRQGNVMIGALYDAQQPDTFTCFNANIGEYGVDVVWSGNLSLIGLSGNQVNRSYSIETFTIDNSIPSRGLDNPKAVQQCQSRFSE